MTFKNSNSNIWYVGDSTTYLKPSKLPIAFQPFLHFPSATSPPQFCEFIPKVPQDNLGNIKQLFKSVYIVCSRCLFVYIAPRPSRPAPILLIEKRTLRQVR